MKKAVYICAAFMLILTACSGDKIDDKTLFEGASKLLKEEKYPMAVMQFEKLVKEYPQSDYYPKSLMELGNIYNAKFIRTMDPLSSTRKAVYYFKKVYTEFPVSTHGEQALFLTGFIYNNELRNVDSARIAYSLFIQKYPESRLIASVKAELNNLGKTPDEIIDKK